MKVNSKDRLIMRGVEMILKGLDVDTTDHNFRETPQRVLKVYRELFRPPETSMPVFDEEYTDIVVMRDVIIHTLCPHHLLPVELLIHVAYIPNGKVIGASKLIRMMNDANRGPMTQERLTAAILNKVDELTSGGNKGTAIMIKGAHGCFSLRGVKCPSARMVTAKFSGIFHEGSEKQIMQDRFYHLVNGR